MMTRAPEIMAFAGDGERDLIKMPLVSRVGPAAPQLIGIGLSELPTPIPHGFVGQDDPTLGHELFDVPVAQTETEVEPHTVTDDLGREPMTLVGVITREHHIPP